MPGSRGQRNQELFEILEFAKNIVDLLISFCLDTNFKETQFNMRTSPVSSSAKSFALAIFVTFAQGFDCPGLKKRKNRNADSQSFMGSWV